MTIAITYAAYRAVASGSEAAGHIWNCVIWDGQTSWRPPAGSAVVADPTCQYLIGSMYSMESAA